ncbi:HesA/MoeB/ThiF family protein [Vulcanisaeta souniana]|uniref:Thiazole biosynthesis protein ThiF n=1 Tax=Vulcanisaeta souniana JCM 11219 TaxID=1293586 RepID=A0A830E662_9CREN|nr:HesA/MoeB/ThiF family protein [Vulcanisaeta souniana]BDR92212.1 thiazole biosynthesis protein ThiF [Vulcanisaeta souniana JCM 11219]GGI67084.1 thiazole biosynthesis protein ThiF [Vulcanisaeta souniana JCM 11219]
MSSIQLIDRYSRQVAVIGKEGQEKLSRARVAVIGLGGLGSLVSMYLAGAGVGELTIVDYDTISVTDLHRQLLYREEDVGKPKVEVAISRLHALNPTVKIKPVNDALVEENAEVVLDGVDVVVDALDNWLGRQVLNEAIVKLRKPLVHGAVNGWYGQVSTIIPGRTPCLFELVHARSLPQCVGYCPVIGPVVGVVASIEATEVIKLITGIGEPLINKLLIIDGKNWVIDEIKLSRVDNCPVCSRYLKEK